MEPRFKHFGEGLFETFRVERGKLPPYFEYHYERLKSGALFFNIPYPSFGEFKSFVEYHLRGWKNFPNALYVKVLLLSLGEGYFGGKATDYKLDTVIKPFTPPKGPLTLTLSPYRRHSQNPLWRFKTLNFLFNVAVKREAQRRGFYDGLILNEKGNLTETSSANFYCLKGGILFTPPVEEGLLPGVIRRVLLEEKRVTERVINIKELKSCEAFYISNSLLGLREVRLQL